MCVYRVKCQIHHGAFQNWIERLSIIELWTGGQPTLSFTQFYLSLEGLDEMGAVVFRFMQRCEADGGELAAKQDCVELLHG
jgi:hypothetical protein